MTVLVVTGTGTGVGKTVVTAAVATLARDRGIDVAVVKAAQTGVEPGEPGDLDHVRALSGVEELYEYARFPAALSPAAAARLHRRTPVELGDVARHVGELAERHRLVLVEGAGGLLVRYDDEGSTVADLARTLAAPVLLVSEAGLGSLNTTALTLEALANRGLELAGLVIGSWPASPDLACRSNIVDMEMLAARPLAGAVPAGAGHTDAAAFRATARACLAPALGGTFNAHDFRESHRP
ncbi:dethiobiotin synthase [Protofrankia sp. BMG5.30]|uniref:dethiobiotin synthase n=1 Tax=Protofrankia sp. BMG5.30 TaxID=1834514 RepID=UPI00097812BE|nr:dethiobiotin synthase [Protofrankia sp. BMG5.30]ONH38341.1 dethiobiotin synthase [Protofrankia sp. BMG5.30]